MVVEYAKENVWKEQKINAEVGGLPKFVVDLNVVDLFRNVEIEGTGKSYNEKAKALWRVVSPETNENPDVLIAEVKMLTGRDSGKKFNNVLLQKSQTQMFNSSYKMCFKSSDDQKGNCYLSDWIVPCDINFSKGDYGYAMPTVVDVAILIAKTKEENQKNINAVMGVKEKDIELKPQDIYDLQWRVTADGDEFVL